MPIKKGTVMNKSYVRIIITCLLVGITMLFLRKKSDDKSAMSAASCDVRTTEKNSALENSTSRAESEGQLHAEMKAPIITTQDQSKTRTPSKRKTRSERKKNKRKELATIEQKAESPVAIAAEVAPAPAPAAKPAHIDVFNVYEAPKKPEKTYTEKANTEEQIITINPEISSKKLSYRYGLISYSPTDISLSINDKKIIINNTDPITITIDKSGIISTCCEYKFIAGYEGKKTARWKVKPGTTTLTATFSWKTPEKIDLNGAELISVED
jgi:hypothetical protein